MQEEGEMRPDDDGEPLGDVPVPGVRAIEISHTVKDVKLEEVELHHGPLEGSEYSCYIQVQHVSSRWCKCFGFFYLLIKQTVDHSGNHEGQSPESKNKMIIWCRKKEKHSSSGNEIKSTNPIGMQF